ncbi:MAG: hypothetical protein AAGD96_17910, partial [Chloroflexota bacterium]
HRTQSKPMFKRGWLVALLWTSEEPSLKAAEVAILETIYRGAWINQHGFTHNLTDIMTQEGYAQSCAGLTPTLTQEDLQYTQEVLAPYFANEDQPTLIAALYGDHSAGELGYPKLGLSPRAGLDLALAQALNTI